jgi:PAS domain S-box-containing protein
LVDNSPDAVSLIDRQGEILYGSASATKLFGYQPEEFVGRNCLDLIHPEDRDHSTWILREVVAKPPGPLHWDARIRHQNGKYSWVESTVCNLLSESEVQAIVMHQRDIQARRAADAENKQQAERLATSNLRLEEFAYTAAHDLREPLRAISIYTELLARRMQLDSKDRKITGFIIDGAARMSALVDDLLCFATTGMQEPCRPVNLTGAVAQATQNLALAIEAGGAVVTVDWLPIVESSEIQLVRLFQNLISNAVKYRSERTPEIHISAVQRGRDWTIRVQDNGLGIAERDRERVFMPFVRLVKRDIPGTGLGLAVCKKIVEGLGGKIWVDSELGAGSTFSFTILTEDAVA